MSRQDSKTLSSMLKTRFVLSRTASRVPGTIPQSAAARSKKCERSLGPTPWRMSPGGAMSSSLREFRDLRLFRPGRPAQFTLDLSADGSVAGGAV